MTEMFDVHMVEKTAIIEILKTSEKDGTKKMIEFIRMTELLRMAKVNKETVS